MEEGGSQSVSQAGVGSVVSVFGERSSTDTSAAITVSSLSPSHALDFQSLLSSHNPLSQHRPTWLSGNRLACVREAVSERQPEVERERERSQTTAKQLSRQCVTKLEGQQQQQQQASSGDVREGIKAESLLS